MNEYMKDLEKTENNNTMKAEINSLATIWDIFVENCEKCKNEENQYKICDAHKPIEKKFSALFLKNTRKQKKV